MTTGKDRISFEKINLKFKNVHFFLFESWAPFFENVCPLDPNPRPPYRSGSTVVGLPWTMDIVQISYGSNLLIFRCCLRTDCSTSAVTRWHSWASLTENLAGEKPETWDLRREN